MKKRQATGLGRYSESLAGTLLAAREAVMAPIRPFLRAANVTEQQWRVLRVLADAEALDASDIAEQALLYAPTVSRILRDLTDRGLVTRCSDPQDGRRSIISITPIGFGLVEETASHTQLILKDYKNAFGEERLAAFIAEARELAATLRRFSPDG